MQAQVLYKRLTGTANRHQGEALFMKKINKAFTTNKRKLKIITLVISAFCIPYFLNNFLGTMNGPFMILLSIYVVLKTSFFSEPGEKCLHPIKAK